MRNTIMDHCCPWNITILKFHWQIANCTLICMSWVDFTARWSVLYEENPIYGISHWTNRLTIIWACSMQHEGHCIIRDIPDPWHHLWPISDLHLHIFFCRLAQDDARLLCLHYCTKDFSLKVKDNSSWSKSWSSFLFSLFFLSYRSRFCTQY